MYLFHEFRDAVDGVGGGGAGGRVFRGNDRDLPVLTEGLADEAGTVDEEKPVTDEAAELGGGFEFDDAMTFKRFQLSKTMWIHGR